ncbi:hypothetical protein [Helicobacter sp. T3_23-1056]
MSCHTTNIPSLRASETSVAIHDKNIGGNLQCSKNKIDCHALDSAKMQKSNRSQ